MTKRSISTWRKTVAVVSAGLLFQAGGCMVSSEELGSALLRTIANNLISQFIDADSIFAGFRFPEP